jgi:hypothetical protein
VRFWININQPGQRTATLYESRKEADDAEVTGLRLACVPVDVPDEVYEQQPG